MIISMMTPYQRSSSPRSSITFEAEAAGWTESEIRQFESSEAEDLPTKAPIKSQPFHEHENDPNLVQWDGPHDPENPQNWSARRRWLVIIVVILMSVNVTYASSVASETTGALVSQFGVTHEVSYLGTTCFLLGYVVGPFFWGPGSELIGRRPIFLSTMILYTLFILGQALAPNIQTLLVTRLLSGFFAISPLVGSGGVIADVFPADGRGLATSLFCAAVFLGPSMGPVVGGFIIASGVSWRWVYWVLMIFAGVCTIIAVVLLPETYAPILLLRKAKRLRKADPARNANLYATHEKHDWSCHGILKRTLFKPFQMLALEPILVLITLYTCIVYGLIYGLLEALPVIFVVRRGFSTSQGGLIFIAVAIGTTLGCLLNTYLSRNYKQLIKEWRGFPPPEYRLWGALVGAPTLVIAIFWLGWTGEYASVPWYVPGLATIMVGLGISLIFISFMTYIVDTYLIHSATAFAANSAIRSAAAAAFPLFTTQMFENLRVNWSCTLLGLVALLFVPSPFLFYRYGAKIRERSRFAPCTDLKIAKELEAGGRKLNEKVDGA